MTENNIYTTGELAEACGITVRSVQYYDEKGLLVPTDYSEGGRRIYSQADETRLRYILLLKAMGLKLAQIKGILESPNSDSILDALLAERRTQIEAEVAEREEMLKAIRFAQSELKLYGRLTTTSQAAMDDRMSDRKAMIRWRVAMVIFGIMMDVAWIGTLVYGILAGIWWPFPIALAFVAAMGIWLVVRTSAHTAYLCPVCHAEFRPKIGAFFIAGHTPTTRRLTCPCCGVKDWCIERYYAERLPLAPGECLPGTCAECSRKPHEESVR